MQSIWEILDIEATGNEREIKRAYAKKLKVTRPEDDQEGFKRLRASYDEAIAYATRLARIERESNESTDNASNPTAAPAINAAEPLPTAKPALAATNADLNGMPQPSGPVVPEPVPAPPEQMALAPDPAPPADSTFATAHLLPQLWQKMIAHSSSITKRRVELFLEKEAAFQNLPLREAFEFHACCYCNRDDAEQQVVDAIVEAFGWQNEMRHLQRFDHDLPLSVMARYSANKTWQAVYYKFAHQNPPLKAMMENRKLAARDTIMLSKRSHVRQLQIWLHAFRWQYPEVHHYKLKPEIFANWENWASSRRYFQESLLQSLFLGLPFAYGWMLILGRFNDEFLSDRLPDHYWRNLALGEISSFILIALWSFFPLGSPMGRLRDAYARGLSSWQAFRQRYLHTLLTDHRAKMSVHQQCIANFTAVGITLYWPLSPSLQIVQTILLLQAVLGLLFIASLDLGIGRLLLALAFAVIAALASSPMYPHVGMFSLMLFFFGVGLMILRGSQPLQRIIGAAKLEQLRLIWLLPALTLAIAARQLPHITAWQQPLVLLPVWLLCIGGWQICDLYLSAKSIGRCIAMFPVLPPVLFILAPVLPPIPQLLFLLLDFICIFTIANLIFTRTLR